MNADELALLTKYFQKTFNNATLTVRARPKIKDSAELYIGEEFLGVVTKIIDEGETSYDLSMSILDFDLEEL